MQISTDFCGGNAANIVIDGDNVSFIPDLRDTADDWFYWAVRVDGANGRTVKFTIPRWVGPFGAAVSCDLESWEWSGESDGNSFTYTFGEDEDSVYFAHDMLYHPSRFHLFAERHGIHVKHLCDDNKGTPIPFAEIGEGERTVILTARHHACEATGDYVMEGIIEEYLKAPLPGVKLVAIPFIDADGVVAGDQGKERRPHDHNRDYGEFLYNGTRAVKSLMDKGGVLAVFDLHSPWHRYGRNDKAFCVRKLPEALDKMKLFGSCFEAEIDENSLKYSTADDIDPGVEWNKVGPHTTCGTFCSDYPGVELGFTLETTYFGEVGNVVSQDKLVGLGRCFWRGFVRYLKESGVAI